MNSPLVSAIVPVHNAARYLRETLDSLCNQTLREIEIICVENGSTDESAAILQDYAALDGRIRIITLPPVGAGAARNKGIDEACGKYVSLHDADDLFEPDMLEVFYRRAEQYGADVVTGLLEAFYDDGRIDRMENQLAKEALKGVDIRSFCPSRDVPGHVFNLMPPWSWGKLYKREFLNKHNIRYLTIRRGEDVPFVYLSLYHARAVSVVDRVFTHYRQHSNSLSHNLESEPYAFVEAYRHMRRVLEGTDAPLQVVQSLYKDFLSMQYYQGSIMNRPDQERFHASVLPEVEAEFRILEKMGTEPEMRENLGYAAYKRFVAPEASVTVEIDGKEEDLLACLQSLETRPVEIWLEAKTPAAKELAQKMTTKVHHLNGCTPAGSAFRIPQAIISSTHFIPAGVPLGKLLSTGGNKGEPIKLNRYAKRMADITLFYLCRPGKQTWKFFGVPILTRAWSKEGQRWFLLGRNISRFFIRRKHYSHAR